jgi:DNA-binding NarL/FixJ family response regulator
MKVLLVSSDPSVRQTMALAARSAGRGGGVERFEVLEAADGVRGLQLAWRHRPHIIVADEITSRAGAFALTKDLKGAEPPFPGGIVILLERESDAWLADWAKADAWFVKPVDPFALAETLRGLVMTVEEEAG